MMANVDYAGIALVVTAFATVVTAVGIAIVGVITARQKKILDEQKIILGQVEKQGNSVALELLRTNMVYSRRLAISTKDPADIAIANDTQAVYEAAVKRAMNKP